MHSIKNVYHILYLFSENFKIKDDYPLLVVMLLLGPPIQNKVVESQSFPCDVCSKKFKNKDLLRQYKYCHRSQLFRCPYCFEKFKGKKYIPIRVKKKDAQKHPGMIKSLKQ